MTGVFEYLRPSSYCRQESAGDDGDNYAVVIFELLWHCVGAALIKGKLL